jgi:hypothetical protein
MTAHLIPPPPSFDCNRCVTFLIVSPPSPVRVRGSEGSAERCSREHLPSPLDCLRAPPALVKPLTLIFASLTTHRVFRQHPTHGLLVNGHAARGAAGVAARGADAEGLYNVVLLGYTAGLGGPPRLVLLGIWRVCCGKSREAEPPLPAAHLLGATKRRPSGGGPVRPPWAAWWAGDCASCRRRPDRPRPGRPPRPAQ